jgi:hypothetical protein
MDIVTGRYGAIRTRPYVLDEQLIMGIIQWYLLKQRLLLMGLSFLVGLALFSVQTSRGPNSSASGFAGLAFGVLTMSQLVAYLIGITRYRQALDDQGWFSIPRWIQIDSLFFVTSLTNSESSKAKLDGLFKAVEFRGGYYLLHYAAENLMTFIPAEAFESPDDQRRFEALLAQKGVKIARKDG